MTVTGMSTNEEEEIRVEAEKVSEESKAHDPARHPFKYPTGKVANISKDLSISIKFPDGTRIAKSGIISLNSIARIVSLLEKKGGVYNVFDTRQPLFGDISISVAKQLGKDKPLIIPYWVAWCMAKMGDLLGSKAPVNSNKLEKMTNSHTFSNEKAKHELVW